MPKLKIVSFAALFLFLLLFFSFCFYEVSGQLTYAQHTGDELNDSAEQEITVGEWRETDPFVADDNHGSHPHPSFAIGSYYYVHTKTKNGGDDRILYYAKQRSDGSLEPWRIANNDHGGGPHGYTAVALADTAYHFRNGHIIRYVVNQQNGVISELKEVEKKDLNGFNGIRYMWDTAVYTPFDSESYIYHLGGFNMNGHAYNSNKLMRIKLPIPESDVSFTEVGTVPTENPNKAAFYRPTGANYGYIFMGVRNSSALKKLQIFENGNIGSWSDAGNLPEGSGNNLGDIFVVDNQLFVIRGRKVFQATIGADGSLSQWDDLPPDLPAEQINPNWDVSNTEGASYGIINDYVYVTGVNKVYYAKIINKSDGFPIEPISPSEDKLPQCEEGNYSLNFGFGMDKPVSLDVFRSAGGLTIKAYNLTRRCQLIFPNWEFIERGEIEGRPRSRFFVISPLNGLPSGIYQIILSAPRNISQTFNTVDLLNLPESSNNRLYCAAPTEAFPFNSPFSSPLCGDFRDVEQIKTKILYSGDANHDNVINLLDFELYRHYVSKSRVPTGNNDYVGENNIGNNADFDYNGKVEFNNGNNDDFFFLKTNFGKRS